jgi:hypothetical protein
VPCVSRIQSPVSRFFRISGFFWGREGKRKGRNHSNLNDYGIKVELYFPPVLFFSHSLSYLGFFSLTLTSHHIAITHCESLLERGVRKERYNTWYLTSPVSAERRAHSLNLTPLIRLLVSFCFSHCYLFQELGIKNLDIKIRE